MPRYSDLNRPLVEVEEILPYCYGRSGKPTQVIAFIIGLLIAAFLLLIGIICFTTAIVCTLGLIGVV